jgi:uncharacterized Zn-binding protein involved in type VI secretion
VGLPAAKQGDQIVATDTHIVMVPTPVGDVPTPLPHLFSGNLTGGLSVNVNVLGRPAATAGSTADNTPAHLPSPPGTRFLRQPSNKATVQAASLTVRINGKAAARAGDPAVSCNDPADLPIGTVVASGTVRFG